MKKLAIISCVLMLIINCCTQKKEKAEIYKWAIISVQNTYTLFGICVYEVHAFIVSFPNQ